MVPHGPHKELKAFKPAQKFFVGIDSDGCAFDTMEPKHKECFCPITVWKWDLASVSKYAREAWDFVNLYSTLRGCNRFHALQHVMNLLRERAEVKRRAVAIPELQALAAWTQRETALGNPALEAEVKKTGRNGCARNTVTTSTCKTARANTATSIRAGTRNNVTRYALPCATPSNRIRRAKANAMTHQEQSKRRWRCLWANTKVRDGDPDSQHETAG